MSSPRPFRRTPFSSAARATNPDDLPPRKPLSIPPISLLWPGDVPAPDTRAATDWQADLGLGDLVQALDMDKRYLPFARRALGQLVSDPVVIAWRQAVFADLWRQPALVEHLAALTPRLAQLRQDSALLGGRRRSLLLETADRLAELDLYTQAVAELHTALSAAPLTAPALRALHGSLGALLDDEAFQTLRAALPDLRAPLQRAASLTIGVNLDTELRPLSAVLLAVNERPLTERASFLERLIGLRADPDDETGIAPVHHVPAEPDMRPFSPLFQDLERLMQDVAQPVARALGRYTRVSSATLSALEGELAFFVAAARLVQRLEARGVRFCQPEIAPAEARLTQLSGLVNLGLCLRLDACPVASDVGLDDAGRIAILTGPNSGGKTTYVQAVGLAQVLFQAGLPVPALTARLSPVDTLLTHFPQLETRQQGRLAEEAARLRTLFTQVTPHSLVLLNETFSSTAFGEALYLAQDVLCALRAVGARAVYATHLVELVERIPDIEAAVIGDSRLYSLVAGIDLRAADDPDSPQAVPNFRVMRGLPLGRSYAQEIARRHGISLGQLLTALGKTPPPA